MLYITFYHKLINKIVGKLFYFFLGRGTRGRGVEGMGLGVPELWTSRKDTHNMYDSRYCRCIELILNYIKTLISIQDQNSSN